MRFHHGLSIFYNTLLRASKELFDFLVLFVLIIVIVSLCGHVTFGVIAADYHFAQFDRAVSTTLGIAFGHYDYDTIVGAMFGLDSKLGAMFYWTLNIVMFLMLNILMAIILDAFEKNQDDRKHIDEAFLKLLAFRQPQRLARRFCCSRCRPASFEKVDRLDKRSAYEFIEEKGWASTILDGKVSKQELSRFNNQ